MNRYFLTVEAKGIRILKNRKSIGIARTSAQMLKILERADYDESKDIVLASSSLDFPKEYTSDKKTLALVDKIR